MNRIFLTVFVVAIQYSFFSCSMWRGPRTESETHFLKRCNCDYECSDGLKCINQICTRNCETDADCVDLYDRAECLEPQKLCDLPCQEISTCRSFDDLFNCQSEFCREEIESSPDATLDRPEEASRNADRSFDRASEEEQPEDRPMDVSISSEPLSEYTIEDLVVFRAETAGQHFSTRIVGDLDGDGLDDFLLSDYGGTDTEGSLALGVQGVTYLFYGREDFESEIGVVNADAVFRDTSGLISVGKCDFDGDELHDFIIAGADDYSEYPAGLNGTGAYLIYGNANRMSGDQLASEAAVDLITPAALAMTEPASNQYIRFDAECAGDLNGDGFDDFFVVELASRNFNVEIIIYVVLGGENRLPDLFLLENADARITGSYGNFTVCEGATSVGDTDNDGYDDLLIHFCLDPPISGRSEMGLFYGGANRFTADISPAEAEAVFDWVFSWTWWDQTTDIGDINRDGLDDIVLYNNQGRRFGIVYGQETRFDAVINETDVDVWLRGPEGYSSSLQYPAVGDIDGDGLNDLIIGISEYSVYGRDQKSALLVIRGIELPFSNNTVLDESHIVRYGSELANLVGPNESIGDISSGGDINGDGFDDILVGAHGDVWENEEYVYLLFAPLIQD